MSPRSGPALPLIRLLLIGAVAPAVFALCDQWLVQRTMAFSRDSDAAGLMAALVVQTGVLGILCGRLVEPAWLRWFIYGWSLVLMDLNVLWLSDSWQASPLLAGQVGLVTVWAVLGTTHWPLRWSVALIVAVALAAPVLGRQDFYRDTGALFLVQTAALCLICGVLRSQGYGLRLPAESFPDAANGAGSAPRLQFGLRDLLFWTTALAVILAIAQRARWTMLTTGGLASIVLVAALWAALGHGPAWLRWPILAAFAAVAGIAYAIVEYFGNVSNASWSTLWTDTSYFLSYHWAPLIWPPLAGGLLFAALLIFRTRSYRLSRQVPIPNAINQ